MFKQLSLVGILCGLGACSAVADEPRQKGAPNSASVERTAEALVSELAGNNAKRSSLLSDAIAEDPSNPAPRWLSGQVRVGNEWLPYAQVADHGDRWREVYRYQQERAKKRQTVDDQLFMADGARHHKLLDEERAHLKQVVFLDPSHVEAHQRLGDVFLDGAWTPREKFERAVLTNQEWTASLKDHGKPAREFVTRLRRTRLNGKELLKQFNDWYAPEKIPALEAAVGDAGDSVHSGYVDWLSTFPAFEASRALVRQALFSERETIRLQSMEWLSQRPTEHFVQELISSLTLFHSTADPVRVLGQNASVVSVAWETFDSQTQAQWLLRHPVDYMVIAGDVRAIRVDYNRDAGVGALAFWKAFHETKGASDTTRNARALRIVSHLAKAKMGDAKDAWDWWKKKDDVERKPQKITGQYEDNWYVDTRRRLIYPTATPVSTFAIAGAWFGTSCLAAGTLITTETGPRAIETIEPGDRVLSQDLETGELTFKPVFARTVREKAKLYQIRTADNEVTCSQGHSFWINGQGWVQARALQPKMPLHTVQGSVEVASVEPGGEGTVYNLVVADSHTYFVGKENAFLSHDVTARLPTNALVPGLQPVWEVGTEKDAEKPLTAR